MPTRSSFLQPIHVVGLIAVALAIKALQIWWLLPLAADYGLIPDTLGGGWDLYLQIARNLADGHGFRITPDTAETMVRGPGYPYFLAGLIELAGDSDVTILIGNLLLNLATAATVFFITQRLTGAAPVSLFCATLAFLHPAMAFLETRASLESFFTLLMMLFILCFYRALETDRRLDYLFTGILLGLAVLTRSTLLPVAVFMLAYLAWRYRKRNEPGRIPGTVLAVVIGGLLVVSPWMLRNQALTGAPSISESVAGVSLYHGLYVSRTQGSAESYGERLHEASAAQKEVARDNGVNFVPGEFYDTFTDTRDEIRYNEVLVDYVLEEYAQDPLLFLRHCLYNTLRFWFQGTTPSVSSFIMPFQVMLLILTSAGLFLAVRRRVPILPLLMPAIALYAASIPIIAHARHSLPLVPIMAILIGFAVQQVLQSFGPRLPNQKQAAASAWALGYSKD